MDDAEEQFEEVRQRAAKYKDIEFYDEPGQFGARPKAQNSFWGHFWDTGGGTYQVSYDGWHEHFDDRERALNCFAYGLVGEVRLKVTLRGSFECAWTLQVQDESGAWVDESTTGLIFVPLWRKQRYEIRQNCLTPLNDLEP